MSFYTYIPQLRVEGQGIPFNLLYNNHFMALTTRVWSAGKLLLLAGALVLTYVLFAAAAMRMALKSREVVVPQPWLARR